MIPLCLIILISGCSENKKKTTTVCDMQDADSGNISEVITIKASGDEINTYTSNVIIDYTDALSDSTQFSKAEVAQYLNQQLTALKLKYNYQGIKFKAKLDGYKINALIKIDLKVVSKKALVSIGYLSSDSKKSGYASLETTLKGLKATGGVCSGK